MDQSQQVKAQDEMNAAFLKNQSQAQTKVGAKKFYMRTSSRYVLPSGKSLLFVKGCLETNIKEEIEEIEKAMASGAPISKTPVAVVKTDSLVMKEVGEGKKGVTSQTIANLAADSN